MHDDEWHREKYVRVKLLMPNFTLKWAIHRSSLLINFKLELRNKWIDVK
jgi:hypothetical protein